MQTPRVLPLREQPVSLETGRLNVAIGPRNGSPLLLIHGVLRGWRDFQKIIPALIPEWQVFAIDLRGHGDSFHASEAYLVADYLNDVCALLEEQVREPALIWGHSLGALLGGLAAVRKPESVRALVLEDPPVTVLGPAIQTTCFFRQFAGIKALLAKRGSRSELLSALSDMPVQHPATGAEVRLGELRSIESLQFSAECLSRVDPEVLTPLIEGRWLAGIDVMKKFKRITCPTLILRGESERGAMLLSREARELADSLRKSVLIDVPGVGHLIHETEPEKTLQFVQDFVGRLSEPAKANV
jgi:pimeloyl-ACP methyl ester carboxylesterase